MVVSTIERNQDRPAPQMRARSVVALAGVPETTIRAAEAFGPVDWYRLAGAVDRMFLVDGGRMAHRRFWFTRDVTLGGLSPLEALKTPGGVDRVATLAGAFIRPPAPRSR